MPPPTGVTDEQWAGFLDHRRAKRQTLTPRAYELLCKKLVELAEAGWPPGEMIDRAIERGWITVFEPKDELNGKRTGHNGSNRHGNPMVRAVITAEGLGDPGRDAPAVGPG